MVKVEQLRVCLLTMGLLLVLAEFGVVDGAVNPLPSHGGLIGGVGPVLGLEHCDASDESGPIECEALVGHVCSDANYKIVTAEEGQVLDLLSKEEWKCKNSGCRNVKVKVRAGAVLCTEVEPSAVGH